MGNKVSAEEMIRDIKRKTRRKHNLFVGFALVSGRCPSNS